MESRDYEKALAKVIAYLIVVLLAATLWVLCVGLILTALWNIVEWQQGIGDWGRLCEAFLETMLMLMAVIGINIPLSLSVVHQKKMAQEWYARIVKPLTWLVVIAFVGVVVMGIKVIINMHIANQ